MDRPLLNPGRAGHNGLRPGRLSTPSPRTPRNGYGLTAVVSGQYHEAGAHARRTTVSPLAPRGRMNDANAPALPLGERRDRVVDLLCRHYAADHMTLEEFERRLDLAHRARDVAELDALLAGLPAVPAPAAAPVEPRPAIPARPERGTAIAIMGGSVRKGRWTPAAQTLALAGWGGVELDFREAQL